MRYAVLFCVGEEVRASWRGEAATEVHALVLAQASARTESWCSAGEKFTIKIKKSDA